MRMEIVANHGTNIAICVKYNKSSCCFLFRRIKAAAGILANGGKISGQGMDDGARRNADKGEDERVKGEVERGERQGVKEAKARKEGR